MTPKRRLDRLPLITLALALAVLPARAAVVGDPTVRSATAMGAVGIAEKLSDVMRRQAAQGARAMRDAEEELQQPDRTHLQQNPGSLAASSLSPAGQGFGARPDIGPFTPQVIGTSFTAATLQSVNPTFSFPPDDMGAVGPTQYVAFENGRLISFNKTTGLADGVLNADPDVFFASVINASSTSDPRIRYDRLSGRWILAIINVSTPNRILIAVSDAASSGVISGATVFTFFFINIASTPPAIANNCLADYPTMGVDANAVYIGTNNFCGSPSQTYNSSDGYVIRKSSIMGPGPIVVTVFRGLVASISSSGPYAPQGVDNLDPAATEGYFIGVDAQLYGLLQFRRVSNPGGTPTVSPNIPITVLATDAPLNSNHLGNTGGTNGRLSAVDDRLFAAHVRNGRLWTAHNVGVDNTGVSGGTSTRDGARWYEMSVPVGSGTPTLLQTGTVFTASGTNLTDQRNYLFPSIMVSGQGHAAMGFTTAGSSERANAATVGRLAGDAASTMQTPTPITASASAYNPPSDPGSPSTGRRWGDYSYTSLDPLDDMTMWTVQQFCNANNSYGVQVTRLIAPPPATPSSIPDVAAGANPVTVTLTGVPASGSGFFDPGPNLPGVPAYSHLSASITNGAATGTPPAVVSATWLTPTTVSLVLNASAATASVGAERYTIAITNPDGQSASAAILRVTGGAPPVATIATGPSAAEGDLGTSTFDFTVDLSAPAPAPLTVDWQTSDGTATVGDGDYVAGNGQVAIGTGASSGTIHVTVNGDTKHEGDETFTVTLTGATGATLGATVAATGTILNDDAVPSLSIANVSAAEGSSGTTAFVFTVSLSNTASQAVSVDWATSDGTATVASGDYTAAGGTLTIPALTPSGTVTVQVNADTCGEANETFSVALTNPSGATLGTSPATGTIQNDDDAIAPAVTVSLPNGGEVLEVAADATLQWTATDAGTITGVDILLSRDGGATYPEILATGLPNTGSFTWTVTTPATTTAFVQVRAHDAGCNTGNDVSDAAFEIADHVTGVPPGGPVTDFALGAVRPNPSRGSVQFSYDLPRDAHVRVGIVDVQGREVALLANGSMGAGRHAAVWSGVGTKGPASRGLYFVRYVAEGRTFTRRFALIR